MHGISRSCVNLHKVLALINTTFVHLFGIFSTQLFPIKSITIHCCKTLKANINVWIFLLQVKMRKPAFHDKISVMTFCSTFSSVINIFIFTRKADGICFIRRYSAQLLIRLRHKEAPRNPLAAWRLFPSPQPSRSAFLRPPPPFPGASLMFSNANFYDFVLCYQTVYGLYTVNTLFCMSQAGPGNRNYVKSGNFIVGL